MKRVFAVMLAAATVGCGYHKGGPAPVNPQPAPAAPPGQTTRPATPVNPPANQTTRPTAEVKPVTGTQIQPVPLPPPPPPEVPPLATVDGMEIPRDRVDQLVMDAYGLDMLMRVVQVELAKRAAQQNNLTVTAEDIAAERKVTLDKLFKEANKTLVEQIADAEAAGKFEDAKNLREQLQKDNEMMLQRLLTQQQITASMFDLQMEARANIRKVVIQETKGKITDDNVYEGYMALYGENIRIRFIQCSNLGEIAEVQRRLKAGEPFEALARQLSRNAATRELGGELPPFSRTSQRYPDQFKEVAFSLKTVGEISEPVEANGSYHIMKLIQRIPPKAVKFEDVKESVREQLYASWIDQRMDMMRERLAKRAMDTLQISEPALAKQFKDRLIKRENEIKERDQIARQLERERQSAAEAASTTRPTTNALGLPVLPTKSPSAEEAPASQPAKATDTGALRPPATMSGSDTPDHPSSKSPSTQP